MKNTGKSLKSRTHWSIRPNPEDRINRKLDYQKMTKRPNIKYNYYSDKLAHVQVVINCRNIDAQMCTHEDGLAYNTGAPSIDDVMSSLQIY